MDCDEDADTQHIRVLPDTCVELFVSYTNTPVAIIDNELHERSIVTFRMSKPMDVQMRKGAGCLAICFHPGMAYLFFNTPMHVLANTVSTMDDLWNGMAAEIEDKLASVSNNTERVGIVQKHLLQHLANKKPNLLIEHCLKQVEASEGLISLNRLSYNNGISQRHLSRSFQQCIGLSPKEYLRMARFLRSLTYVKRHTDLSFTEIAYKSGYYDQSHLNRDYKDYAGYTPGQLVRARHLLY